MIFKQIFDPGLVHFSYLIGHGKEAAIIDPRLDITEYLELLGREQLELKYVFETHRNEDYVLGAPELVETTGAEFFHADKQWKPHFGVPAKEGQEWEIGNMKLKALHTPGHTPGSLSYLLTDPDGVDLLVFTGDTLFAGSTGRVDLMGEEKLQESAGQLYDSLHDKLLKLNEGVIVCPAHGSGSVCGSSGAERPLTTIGVEKSNNPHLQFKDKNAFIENLAKMQERPPYFKQMENLNLERSVRMNTTSYLRPLTVDKFMNIASDAIIIDTRPPFSFAEAHLPESISIWKDGLPKYAGWFLTYDKPLLLVTDREHPQEEMHMLVRLGFLNIKGYLAGGILEYQKQGKPTSHIEILPVDQSCHMLDNEENVSVLDVRSNEELDSDGRIKDAIHVHVTQIPRNHKKIPKDIRLLVFCGSGLRSSIAASYLRNMGYKNLLIVSGGISAWNSTKCPVELLEK